VRSAAAVVLAGLIVTGLVAWGMWNQTRREAADSLVQQGQTLAESVLEAVHEVEERLVGVGSFYQASEEVTQAEFKRFIANFSQIDGMGGIGYMPIVSVEDLAEFEAQIGETIPGYFVWEFDGDGDRVPVPPRDSYVPLQWFEPADSFGRPHGFDSTSELERRSALGRALSDKRAAITSFLNLISETETDGFLMYWPVTDPGSNEVFGFTVAPMDLSELLDGQIDGSVSENLVWSIDVLTDGRRPQATIENSWNTVMNVGSNWWSLTVTRPKGAGFQPTTSEMAVVLVVLAGAGLSSVAGVGVYLSRRKTEAQQELDQLRALTRSKDQFLASVSHELRTPLTGVLGFAELLSSTDGELTEEERRSMIVNVAEEATDLAAIIEDLLVAARSELDLLAITRVPVSFRGQVAQVVENTDAATRERIDIVDKSNSTYTASGDPGRVRQIIRNLITNASRYGGPDIQVLFSIEGEVVHLEVTDNGHGVPPSEWERIFEPYYRAHDSATQPAALGIGLSVARHLARLMDGDLTYRREGDRSVFRLSLPVAAAADAAARTPEPAAATA
jgi:signal transduction histidine kinase